MSTWIKEGGSWKKATTNSIKVNGHWVDAPTTFIKVNGKWEDVNALPISFEMEVEATAKPTFPLMKGKLIVTDLTGGKYNVKGYGNIDEPRLKDTTITTAVVKNMHSVGYMNHMWEDCINLTSVIYEQGLTYNVSINGIFNFAKNCVKLTHLDMSPLIGCKILYAGSAFKNCKVLPALDVSALDFSDEKLDLGSMAENCGALKKINMSINGDKPKVLNMFKGCNVLECLSNLNTVGSTGNMFLTSPKLVSPDAATLTKLRSSAGFKYEKGSAC